jgi:hypothetical protein
MSGRRLNSGGGDADRAVRASDPNVGDAAGGDTTVDRRHGNAPQRRRLGHGEIRTFKNESLHYPCLSARAGAKFVEGRTDGYTCE